LQLLGQPRYFEIEREVVQPGAIFVLQRIGLIEVFT
jgi:hypothetical protein